MGPTMSQRQAVTKKGDDGLTPQTTPARRSGRRCSQSWSARPGGSPGVPASRRQPRRPGVPAAAPGSRGSPTYGPEVVAARGFCWAKLECAVPAAITS